MAKMISEMRTVVTLVHGTFARDAAWTRPNSKFSSRLRNNLPEPCIVERFKWSGRNRFSDRSAAAGLLASHLSELIEKYPAAQHIVVAHSHGGNILLNIPEYISRKISGRIFLSTPFIFLKRRLDPPLVKFGLISNIFLSIILTYAIFLYSLVNENNYISLDNFDIYFSKLHDFILNEYTIERYFLFNILVSLILSILFLFVMSISVYRANRIEESRNGYPNNIERSSLIIRSVGDEASFIISFSHFLSNFTKKFYDVPAILFSGMVRDFLREDDKKEKAEIYSRSFLDELSILPKLSFSTAFALSLVYFTIDYFGRIENITPSSVTEWIFFIPFLILSFIVISMKSIAFLLVISISLSAIMFWPAWFLSSIAGLALGRELGICAPLFEATAEAAPAGTFQIRQLSYDETDLEGVLLRHSAAYDSEVVIDLIGNWIKKLSAPPKMAWGFKVQHHFLKS